MTFPTTTSAPCVSTKFSETSCSNSFSLSSSTASIPSSNLCQSKLERNSSGETVGVESSSGVTVTSGYRSPEHNNSVSSTGLDGPHTTGLSVDISTNSSTQYQLLRFALNYNPQAMGIGIAKTFTHIDFLTVDAGDKYAVRPNVWRYA